jgi:tetratricopeptide (TPR) repeat protein
MFKSLKYPSIEDGNPQVIAKLEEWELTNPPPTPDMTRHERFKRYFVDIQETRKHARRAGKLMDNMNTVNTAISHQPALSSTTTAAQQREAYPTAVLQQYSDTSQEAAHMLEARVYFLLSKSAMSENDTLWAIQSMALAFRCSELVIAWSKPMLLEYRGACEARLREAPNDPDANIVFAWITAVQGNYTTAAQILSNRAFRNDVDICHFIAGFYSFARDWRNAIKAFDTKLRLGDISDSKVYEAYYTRGHCKEKLGDIEGAKRDYFKFIECCDGNERSLCEAYFQMGIMAHEKHALKEFYLKGLEAKANRCPIFHALEKTNYENMAASFVNMAPKHSCGDPACENPGDKSCSGCGLEWYCSATCQKKMWKSHKKACQDTQKKARNPVK